LQQLPRRAKLDLAAVVEDEDSAVNSAIVAVDPIALQAQEADQAQGERGSVAEGALQVPELDLE
jgi:hypothetical protein